MLARGLIVLSLFASACTRVMPYQRETLARPDMTMGSSELSRGEDHAKSYREGSSGGAAGKAGGCGCN